MNLEKYIGAKFNSLQVLDVWRDVNKNETMCLCLCDCGKEHITYRHLYSRLHKV